MEKEAIVFDIKIVNYLKDRGTDLNDKNNG